MLSGRATRVLKQMPKHLRFKCAFQFHDTDPKNVACINPVFRHQTWQLGVDPLPPHALELTTDLANSLPPRPRAGTDNRPGELARAAPRSFGHLHGQVLRPGETEAQLPAGDCRTERG